MEAAIGVASGLIDGVVNLLSNELVQAYVASTELGLNADKIKTSLFYAQDLLQQARQRGMAEDRPGLQGLVQQLSAKADEAEDALDELHYFMFQDQLDGTKYAVPDLGDDLRGHTRHGRHALRHAVGGSTIPWAELPTLTSLRQFLIEEDPGFLSMALLSNLPTSLTSLSLIDCENLTADGFNPLIAAVNLKKLAVYNTGREGPRSVAADLLSELVVASTTKLLLPAAGCFQLETLDVDCISAMLAAPVCSLFATTLHELVFSCDQRVESFTEEEEDALQLLTSLQTLFFWKCPGLPSLPEGLHSLSSLTELQVVGCPEIRSLPKGGLPASLTKLYQDSLPLGLS